MLRRNRADQGIALVIVLWIVVLLTLMAGSFAYSLRTETTLVTHAAERAQARALAEAGLHYVAFKLLIQPDSEEPWPVQGSEQEWSFGDGTVRISAMDASGRVDINTADRELFKGLLITAAGLVDDEANALLDKIEDYRDADDAHRLHGAEESDYRAAGRSSGPKNAPFESADELQQVLDMTPQIFGQIADVITVDSRQNGINPMAASAKALNAIPDIDPQQVLDYIAQRDASLEAGEPPPPFPLAGPFISNRQGIAYHVRVAAQLENGTQDYIAASISGRRRLDEAFHVSHWRAGKAVYEGLGQEFDFDEGAHD